jgi:integrase
VSRFGRVARTPLSRTTATLSRVAATAPAVSPVKGPARSGWSAEEIREAGGRFLGGGWATVRSRHLLSIRKVTDWLETFPGEDWQQRWLLSGANAAGRQWGPPGLSAAVRERMVDGARSLIVLGVIAPSYGWLAGVSLNRCYSMFREHNHEDGFAVLAKRATAHGDDQRVTTAVNLITRMAIVNSRDPRELTLDDVTHYEAAQRGAGRPLDGMPLAYELLHEVGALKGAPPTLRQYRARGQLTVAELVDRYPIANRGVRDVLLQYLSERAPALDYTSLNMLTQGLAGLFWLDVERHHPGLDTLRLDPPMVQAWKQRLRVRSDGKPRQGVHGVYFMVRAFYLDVQQWALEDPSRWAQWAAPCPITEADIREYHKSATRRQAAMQQRTRTLLPVLPQLVTAAEAELDRLTRMLAVVETVAPGAQFTVDGISYRRHGTARHVSTGRFVSRLDQPGRRFDVERAADGAFWTWAGIEVLRRTGTRIEELLELTHLSMRQYRTPAGETVALLQISPSKTDRERVIPADPDLVAVLARIIRRVKDPATGRIPLLSRYDYHERTFGARLPHLFQRVTQRRLEVINSGFIRNRITELAARADIVDTDGSPLRFTPHDFRRIFSTETVNSGLPIHIAAKLLGHLDLNTTRGYVAVYPEQVIAQYRRYLDARRGSRPAEEYREPTDGEWTEFREHFSLRKVALGTCNRPYGTPCQHEHACIRCPMLRMDLAQVPRLLQIETNTRERLVEAGEQQWLGEVAALQESLRHIAAKKEQAERLRHQADHNEAGPDALR